MCIRSLSVLSAICLFFVGTVSSVVSAQDAAPEDAINWVTIAQPPGSDKSSFVIQVSDGADFKLVDTIADNLPAASANAIRLLPTSQVDLSFRTDAFLVMKLDGNRLILAPGSEFPFAITRSLAKELGELGFTAATIESPETLLIRTDSSDPFARAFAFRDAKPAAARSGVR